MLGLPHIFRKAVKLSKLAKQASVKNARERTNPSWEGKSCEGEGGDPHPCVRTSRLHRH